MTLYISCTLLYYISTLKLFLVYQKDPSILQELEARWEHLASNIFEYNETLPLNLRAEGAMKIKQQYLGNKPVSQETYGQLVQVNTLLVRLGISMLTT